MKISSKLPDYYDNVAWTYGGGDPKIRYERRDFDSDELGTCLDRIAMKIKSREIEGPLSVRCHRDMHNNYSEKLLIVGERVYTVFSVPSYVSHDYGPPKYFLPDATHEIITKDRSHLRDWKKDGPRILYRKSPDAVKLCRLVGQPVFWIAHQYYPNAKWIDREDHFIEIAKEIPRLCRIKNFAKLYPANQIYQDLSYVIGNLMHEPPDDNPPIQVEEKIRLQKKGFDLKTSFRGKQ